MRASTFYGSAVLICAMIFTAGFLWLPSNSQTGSIIVARTPDTNAVTAYIIFSSVGSGGSYYALHDVEHLSALQLSAAHSPFDSGDSNAWTSKYTVGYWQSGRPGTLAGTLKRLSGVFRPLTVPQAFADQERDIILREYDLRMAQNIDAKANEELDSFLYKGSRFAESGIGTPMQIKSFRLEDAKALHDATQRPNQARLVVTGNVTESQVLDAMAAAGFPELTGRPETFKPPRFELEAPGTYAISRDDGHTAPRLIWRKVVKLRGAVDYDLLETQAQLLATILETDLRGGLAGPLRYEQKIAWAFSVTIAPIDERHVEINFSADPDKGVNLKTLQAAFEANLLVSTQN